MSDERSLIQAEFERAAPTFSERTVGRFDHMDVVGFSDIRRGATVVEVGAGTGSFLALFEGRAARLIAIDLTAAMLAEAAARHPDMELVVADGAALPIDSRSIDLVCSAQAFHHIHEPMPVLKEMRRVCRDDGKVLVVDQVATENVDEARTMNELDVLRDPSHAACRPPSAFRIMVTAAGLEIEAERIFESTERLSMWLAPDEFPAARVAVVCDFLAERGTSTGMEWRREGDEWLYTRRRIMLLARRAG